MRLQLLELGDNRIRKIENIAHLTELKELYLGKNKIEKLENLETLQGLRVLNVPVKPCYKRRSLIPRFLGKSPYETRKS